MRIKYTDSIIRRTKRQILAVQTEGHVSYPAVPLFTETYLMSKQVTFRSLTLRCLVISHLSVSHLQTNALRDGFFVRARGGTVFTTVYITFESAGWNRAERKLLSALSPESDGGSTVFSSFNPRAEVSLRLPDCFSLSPSILEVGSAYTKRLTVVAITSCIGPISYVRELNRAGYLHCRERMWHRKSPL